MIGPMADLEALTEDFWRFSLETYAKPGVQALSLALQDDHGCDVNLMLFCLWLADSQGIALESSGVGELALAAGELNNELVSPVRSARRWLKSYGETAREGLSIKPEYDALKSVELKCERLVQRALVVRYRDGVLHSSMASPVSAARASFTAYAEAHKANPDAVKRLGELADRALERDPF
jgi:uncharacterized protein (TIGR02444 family)